MRKLNNISAVFCFVMAIVTILAFIAGAYHQGFITAITLILGFAHLADNQKATRP